MVIHYCLIHNRKRKQDIHLKNKIYILFFVLEYVMIVRSIWKGGKKMNTGVSYSMFYEILLNLREYFHSYGRIDDSNAKLDEIVKLIAINFSLAKKGQKFCIEYVKKIAQEIFGDADNVALGLIEVFTRESKENLFINSDGTNIFGISPALVIQSTENELAEKLISEIEKIDFVYLLENKKYSNFDLINECFGHFVRENFRNNKEDAQYMTPYEISEPVLQIIFHDMERDGYLTNERLKDFKIMDPTCGVGTLLIESSNHFTRYVEKTISDSKERNFIINNFRTSGIIGQDKVERMVRLSKINAILLGGNISNINIGNSIVGKSSICSYYKNVNMIFTNPPFGAEYSLAELNLIEYPILSTMQSSINTVSSELLMLDKCIDILCEGGYLAIVLPDSVFSAKGLNSQYRDAILKQTEIKGIIELPSVTFAQAGTRTNTCVLYVRKKKVEKNNHVQMIICKDLGYIVKEKMGVPVKISKGCNEMQLIANLSIAANDSDKIISEKPSIVRITSEDLIGNILKPSFYAAEKYMTVYSLISGISKGFEIKKLSEIAEFVTTNRKGYMVSENIKHISVLHVNSNCTINFNEVMKFVPVSKGRECEEGDLIFSKINPRIPRMAVIPKQAYKMVCSNEFEIIRPTTDIDAFTLCFLLRTENVMVQIDSMTSGTSSSHSRIKREQLGEILIPVPVEVEQKKKISDMGKKLEKAIQEIYNSEEEITAQMSYLEKIFV